jgi:hypothetical protein
MRRSGGGGGGGGGIPQKLKSKESTIINLEENWVSAKHYP